LKIICIYIHTYIYIPTYLFQFQYLTIPFNLYTANLLEAFTMQLTTAIFTTLSLALSATADQRICFPIPGQAATVPQSILDLDSSVKLNWAATLCSQLIWPSDGLQTVLTATSDGILGDDGKLYGLEVVSISIP
jgi:hypothetical protein